MAVSPARQEPLHPLTGENLARVDNAFGVNRNHMQPEELAAVFAHASHPAHYLAVLAVEEPDVVIRQIGNIQEPLLLVGREHHAAGGTAHARRGSEDEFLDELALLGGDLDAVGIAIGGIDQPVVSDIQR